MTRSHVRSDMGRIILTPRDLWTMRWTAEQKALRYDQLADLLGFWPCWQELHHSEREMRSAGLAKPVPFTINAVRRVVNRWMRKGYAAAAKLVSTPCGSGSPSAVYMSWGFRMRPVSRSTTR